MYQDLSGLPYYDLTELEIAKGFIKVLARPGYDIQSREFNVAQGLLEKAIKDVGDLVAKDGTIVEGLELVVDLVSYQKTVTLGAGRVYIGGRIWSVAAVGPLSIGTPGQDPDTLPNITVDIVLTDTVVTEVQDSILRSPAQGFSNYNQPGAHRLKVTAEAQLNNPTGVTIYTLVQGRPLKLPTTGVFSEIEAPLARQTFDISGNFLVTGMEALLDGEDDASFEDQPQIKPSGTTLGTATISAGSTFHPYGVAWTNRIVNTLGTVTFTHLDIGRRIIISNATDDSENGTYTITDVITANEIEVDGEFTTGGPVNYIVKEEPTNLVVTMAAGQAFVLGYSVLKSVSTNLSVPKASTGRSVVNEVKPLTFRSFEYPFTLQPFKSLTTSGGEGLTAEVFYGFRMATNPASGFESGHDDGLDPTPGPTHDFLGSTDDLASLITPRSVIKVIAVASNAATWQWHLDPEDPLYPGEFSGGTVFPEWNGVGIQQGWKLVGGSLTWGGGVAYEPTVGSTYKVMAVISQTLEQGVDFRIRSNASARMYQQPGGTTTPVTTGSTELFFPQAAYNLSVETTLVVDVDGVRLNVDFSEAQVAGVISNLAAATIFEVANAINRVGSAVGKTNVCTTQLETSSRGWLVLQSPTSGSSSSLSIPTGGGNTVLGFHEGQSATGSSSPQDVVCLGGYRLPSLIAGSPHGDYRVEADYSFGLTRKDLVVLDKDGRFVRLAGNPDTATLATTPSGTINTLKIASLTVIPGTDEISIVNYKIVRLTQPEIRKVRDRLSNVEHNLAILDLDREAVDNSGELVTDLSGVLSDGFVGFTKSDLDFSENGVAYTVALDPIGKEISLPAVETENVLDLDINVGSSTVDLGYGSLITMSATGDFDIVSQTSATEFLTLNQLGVYVRDPKIKLSPSFDNYPRIIDDDQIPLLQDTSVKHRRVVNWVKSRNTENAVEQQISEFNISSGQATSIGDRPSSNRITIEASDKILEEARTILRGRTLTMTGENFPANTNSIKVLFDGRQIPWVAATSGFISGTTGLLTTTAGGQFSATLNVPIKSRRFVHVITVTGIDPATSEEVTATATYRTWHWRSRVTEDAYFTAGRDFLPRKPADTQTRFAPVAQTFSLDRDAMLSGVTLYFAGIASDDENPITVQLRNVTNNVPGEIAYAEKVVYPSDISGAISIDATAAVNGYKVEFDDPVFISAAQEYAIVLSTHSSEYVIAIARVGQTDLATNSVVSQQPFNVGKIFTAANNADWVSADDADLKFVLHAATYSTSGVQTLVFTEQTGLPDFTALLLAVESSPMQDSEVNWFFSTDSGATFYPIIPNEVTQVSPLQEFDSFIIKAELSTEDPLSSPIILKDTVGVYTRAFETEANYVSKKVDLGSETYTAVRQSLKIRDTAGGSVEVYFGYEDSNSVTRWVQAQIDPNRPTQNLGNGVIRRFYYTEAVLPGPDHTSPATLTGTVGVPVTSPSFVFVGGGDEFLDFDVIYFDENEGTAPLSKKTVSVSVTFPTGTVLATTVRDTINAAAATASSGLAVDLSEIASLDSENKVILTHPESGGNQRNKITITTANTVIGFALNASDIGGLINYTTVAGGSLAGLTRYYILTAVLGSGESQDPPEDIDAIQVTFGANGTVEFDLEEGSIDPRTQAIRLYRGTGTPGLPPDQFLTWELAREVILSAPGAPIPNVTGPDNLTLPTGLVYTGSEDGTYRIEIGPSDTEFRWQKGTGTGGGFVATGALSSAISIGTGSPVTHVIAEGISIEFNDEPAVDPPISSAHIVGDQWDIPVVATGTLPAPGAIYDDGSTDAGDNGSRPPQTSTPAALDDLSTFRARVKIESTVTGSSPKCSDLTGVFVRP